MPNLQKSWFIIESGCAPVYKEPNFLSPMLTEALYGESCKIKSNYKSWLNIICEDGYEGWINTFYGHSAFEKNSYRYLVVNPNKNGFFSSLYPFGAMVNNHIDGVILNNQFLDLKNIIEITQSLLGVSYRWGGKSSLGFDCSGLVQAVLKVCGFKVPRDAQDQFNFFHNNKINLCDARVGDLHFFGKNGNISHVGFSFGGLELLHSQGYVKIESLDSSKDNFNQKLLDIYQSTCFIERKFNK